MSISPKNLNIKKSVLAVESTVFAEKADRQITANITCMIFDMGYRWRCAWRDDKTIQAYEAYEQNRFLRKMGKDYIVPFDVSV